MVGFVIRTAVSALALWVASAIVPGIAIEGFGTLVLAALLLGLVNAVVRPILVLLTFPITIVTLGLFLLVVNGAMLGLVAWMLPDFHLAGLGSAVLGAIVVGVVSWLCSWYVGPQGRVEVLVVRR